MHSHLGPLLLVVIALSLSCKPETSPAAPEPSPPVVPAATREIPEQKPETATPNSHTPASQELTSPATSVEDPTDLVISCMKEVRGHLGGLPGDLRLEALATQTVPCYLPKKPVLERYALHQQHTYNAFVLAPEHCYLSNLEPLLEHFQLLMRAANVEEQKKWTQTPFETDCPSARNIYHHTLQLATSLYADMGAFDLAASLCRRGAKDAQSPCLKKLEEQWRRLPEAGTLTGLNAYPVPSWAGGETVVRLPMVLAVRDGVVIFDGEPVCKLVELRAGACKEPLKEQLEKKTRTAMVMYQEKGLKRIPALAVVAENLDTLRELARNLPSERVPTFVMARGNSFPDVVQLAFDPK